MGIACILICLPYCALSQLSDSSGLGVDISRKVTSNYINEVGRRSEELTAKLDKYSEVYLSKLKNQEDLLLRKLSKIDSSAAKRIFTNSSQEYDRIQNELKTNSQNVLKGCGKYIPGIDTTITSLKFLQATNLDSRIPGNITQVKNALSKVQALEDQFKKSDNIEEFIRQRKEYLQQQLASYNLGPGLPQFNKQAYYYAQQVDEFKQDWNDPSKVESRALGLLEKMPAFQKFMEKNSMLAGLFNIPSDYATSGISEGMQTRDVIQKLMGQQMSMMGPNGAQDAANNILDAQSQLTNLRNKIQQTGGGGGDMAMPDFNPNQQKTKTFLKRIEYGFNMQSTKSNLFFPSQTAFAFTAGYKINDRNTVGIGLSYTAGWGKDIQHIRITSQGIGFRSFIDIKIWHSLYGTGGLEYNYTQAFTSIIQLESAAFWQRAGLLGITKMVSIRSSLVKKTKLQLLWNFLSYSQIPRTQPIIFRVGYNF